MAVKVLEGTVEKIIAGNHCSVGLFQNEDKTVLPLNRDLVIMSLKPLENKFKRNLVFHEIYRSTMKDYKYKVN